MACARTMSLIVMTGNWRPWGAPVAGSISCGPLDPMQPPITFEQMTWKRLVSIGNPGPTMVDHQPGLPVIGCVPVAYWSPVSA
jgi:hypothetical protein